MMDQEVFQMTMDTLGEYSRIFHNVNVKDRAYSYELMNETNRMLEEIIHNMVKTLYTDAKGQVR